MKYETVTYDLVRNKLNELAKAGEKITIANALSKTGGSAGKIAGFIKRWKHEQSQINAYSISDQMLSALIAENARAVEKEITIKNKELADLQELLTELSAINEQQTTELRQMGDLKEQLRTKQEQAQLLERQLKEKSAAENKLMAELTIAKQKVTEHSDLLAEQKQLLIRAENSEKQAQQELIAKTAKIEQLEKHVSEIYDRLKLK